MKIRFGTRGSRLAIRQGEIAMEAMREKFPDIEMELLTFTTKGDRVLNRTIDKIGGKGVFIKEIEYALLDRSVDIAVHSLKDMPGDMEAPFVLGGVLKRELPNDVLISKNNITFDELPVGAKIGTGSLRRKMQLLAMRPDLDIVPIRGNIDSRIGKLAEGLDAVVLAAAGVIRNGMQDCITQVFSLEEMVPAGGQGTLALEVTGEDVETLSLLKQVNHEETMICSVTERAFLREFGADCHEPIGAYAWLEGKQMYLSIMHYKKDVIKKVFAGESTEGESLGEKAANWLKNEEGKD